jgi:hypothetical protein
MAAAWPYAVGFVGLACAWPYLSFVDANRGEIIDVGRIMLVFGATVVAAAAVYVGLLVGFRRADPRRMALAMAAGVLCFFSFGAVFGDRDDRVLVAVGLWLVVSTLVVLLAYRLSSSPHVVTFALVFLVALVAIPAIGLAANGVDTGSPAAGAESLAADVAVDPDDDHPNVYWLVFDEYGRADQLDAVLSHDNQDMVAALEARGFTVADDRYTSYPVTALALSSVMAMEYVVTDAAGLAPGPSAWTQVLRGPSPVVDTFHELGYDYLYAETGLFTWNRCDPDYADVCLGAQRQGWAPDELDLALLDLTPIGVLDLAEEPYVDPVTVVDEAQAWGERSGAPFFVAAHILSPHEPYWFGDGCQRRSSPVHGLDSAAHVHELECLNDDILAAVDLVVENDPGAIVVLQSDTGSKILGDWDDPLDRWTEEALEERFAVFEATRMPAGCAAPSGPLTTINTFRIVFACLEGSEPDLVDYRAFMWRHPAPDEITEIDVPPGATP